MAELNILVAEKCFADTANILWLNVLLYIYTYVHIN